MKTNDLFLEIQWSGVTKQVCWNQPREFQNIVVHPGVMYIIVILATLKLNEMLSLGILCHCSLCRNKRYFQWEIMGESYESI